MAQPACIRHLRDYIAIPSVNPMDREDIPDALRGERRYAEHLREQLRGMAIDAEVIGSGDRASVVAELSCAAPIDTLLVASHLDTVPVDNMEIEPFDPVSRDGRIYGRGACDTKAGMAALVAALEQVLERGSLARNLILVGEADEELGSLGVEDVLQHLGGRRPDWVLATEPTELRVATHHKGIVHARIGARGRACHASMPDEGRNAIVMLARAILALEALGREVGKQSDRVLGPATLSIGLVRGGQSPNVVPDYAWLSVDRRLLPGETPQSVERELKNALAALVDDDLTVEECFEAKPPLGTPEDTPAVQACQAALRAHSLSTSPAGVGFGTDAGVFDKAGIPGVVMGPGSIAQAHTDREFVAIDQVERMTEFFVSLLEGRS